MFDRLRPPSLSRTQEWTPEYVHARDRFISETLDDQQLLARFRSRRRLPRGYGVGLDERVIEYPWLFAQEPVGRVLDAGSTLNHVHLLDRLLPRIDALTITTLVPEQPDFTSRGVSYVYADLRELPFRDGWFDSVVCLSTLEHVGMDNSRYGSGEPRSPDPGRELAAAASELWRVLRPGGQLFVSVPYGRREDHGWFRQPNRADLEALAASLGSEATVYRYRRAGWQPSSSRRAAHASYREMENPPAADFAAAARAVACIHGTRICSRCVPRR